METNYSFDSSDSSISYIHFPSSSSSAAIATNSIPNDQPSFSSHRSLHSVRKPAHPNKPWNNHNYKKPNAPLPPIPTRVYKVDRMNFRELVQMLTGASTASSVPAVPVSQSQPRRLHEVAPPPLNLATSAPQGSHLLPEKAESAATSTPLSALYRELMSETPSDAKPSHHTLSDGFHGTSGAVSLGLGLSPSPLGWCSLLSPGTLSSFEPSTVL
ncbi:hypothetical protein CRG98_008330 [Punica granatum]|uniref:VQ domain-containing protein n=1 Tax=Punica granatum TaxID=22663 RepID=A0A2I0KSN7_PUNGR|nr:hypothetical protein CRG98_008330 [Punica granatum]